MKDHVITSDVLLKAYSHTTVSMNKLLDKSVSLVTLNKELFYSLVCILKDFTCDWLRFDQFSCWSQSSPRFVWNATLHFMTRHRRASAPQTCLPSQPIFPSPSESPSSRKALVSAAVRGLAPLAKFCRNSLTKKPGWSTALRKQHNGDSMNNTWSVYNHP